ncbi:MAG: succinate dehydrogenase, cytochrome b556 subunit [Gammaproteobacteria bacterium]|nr:MAG: succinate dehydrogenase, cytochrome b556 subunit [Gammaproteobacteria bacterium]
MEPRPVFLEVHHIRLPVMAVTSFLHRVAGLVLFLAIPPGLWFLQRSLSSEAGFLEVGDLWQGLPGRVLWGVVLWAFAHHFLAGVRFLLMDAGMGGSLKVARGSAWAVNLASPLIALGVFL